MTDTVHSIVEADGPIGLITLNRPKARNALSSALMTEVADALAAFDANPAIRCVILTGGKDVFAAGADIKEMAPMTAASGISDTTFRVWDRIYRTQKPVIAAVCGLALGGGCELALMCDMIVAADTARFGQPEINLGIIPGAGGTQRLLHVVGKARAMEIVLGGQPFSAQDALQWGMINRVVPADRCLDEARSLAQKIANQPHLAVQAAKRSILRAYDTGLEAGLAFERMNFYALFGSPDQVEGRQAFIEKRPPDWQHHG